MPEYYFKPDKIIILTIDEQNQLKRLSSQKDEKWDRKQEFWKSKGGEFQKKINKTYLKIAKENNIQTIDASGTVEEVFERIKKILVD